MIDLNINRQSSIVIYATQLNSFQSLLRTLAISIFFPFFQTKVKIQKKMSKAWKFHFIFEKFLKFKKLNKNIKFIQISFLKNIN